MSSLKEGWRILFIFSLIFLHLGCESTGPGAGDGGDGGDGGGGSGSINFDPLPATLPASFNGISFSPIGENLNIASGLIDVEFLPGQNGESIVIDLGGRVFYLDNNFNQVGAPFDISVSTAFEQGLLGVVADPGFDTNGAIYFYLTDPGGSANRVQRYTVSVNVPGDSFTLTNPQTIIVFPKNENPSFDNRHNGGGMAFDSFGNLVIGVGDGGGGGSEDQSLLISQDLGLSLGKLHRIVPVPTGSTNGGGLGNGFNLPTQPAGDLNQNNPSGPDSIYVLGVRNPFTLINTSDDDNYFSDAGSGGNGINGQGAFEEINCLYHAGENYGWPFVEGPERFNFSEPATWGYRYDDTRFSDEDPEANPMGGHAIMVLAFLEGIFPNYGGDVLDRRLIYSDFFQGWVRALEVAPGDLEVADDHIGHQEGLTSLKLNPNDDFFYGTALNGSNQVLRMTLNP